ncbi:chaperone NapD [uncultured Microbulbifer sp.]|uniref:chaperone NapD n=1 Tax=uncultured Microbulbifer sp. TaxID=348147 RepID=UPI00260DCB23|nr:chaperone NapD [uncultured Microbulbifer sp.]
MREHHYRNRDYTASAADNGEKSHGGTVHIVSLIVHVRPVSISGFSQWVDEQPELEIHLGDDNGKLVVVMETADHHRVNELIEVTKDQSGVLNVAMVYHEEMAVSDMDDVLNEQGAAADGEQPVKIVGEL